MMTKKVAIYYQKNSENSEANNSNCRQERKTTKNP